MIDEDDALNARALQLALMAHNTSKHSQPQES